MADRSAPDKEVPAVLLKDILTSCASRRALSALAPFSPRLAAIFTGRPYVRRRRADRALGLVLCPGSGRWLVSRVSATSPNPAWPPKKPCHLAPCGSSPAPERPRDCAV